MWCQSSDAVRGSSRTPEPHHRIVRIPPGEAVVLNSAERAPYLLLIEILNGDLDFDPEKRGNKEILRKVVTKEAEQKSTWLDFGPGSARQNTPNLEASQRTPMTSIVRSPYFPGGPPTAASSTSAFSNDDEEIDLVEQLYGNDQPLRSQMFDIEDSIALPPTPKNRELDMVTWARSSPIPPSTSGELITRQTPVIPQHIRTPSLRQSPSLSSSTSQTQTPPSESESTRILSLDEYSDRMRTAAIMLAQLNADQGRESSISSSKPNGSPRPDGLLDRTGE